jgi:glycosyltransferase involved in cell wall biosynthesis
VGETILTIQDLTVLLPARNEKESLVTIIPALFAWCQDIKEVVIVVDQSSDNTFEISNHLDLHKYPYRIIINDGQGIAGALNCGVNAANTPYIGVCMADEILPLIRINDFLIKLRSGVSFVSATRYSNGGARYGGSKLGHFLSWLSNLLFRLYSHGKMTDATTGIKFFDKNIWPIIGKNIQYKGWAPALAISMNVLKTSIPVGEVSIISLDRPVGGVSSFQLSNWVPAYLRAFLKTK